MMPNLVEYVSEKELLAEVIRIAEHKGYLVYHSYDSRKSTGAGFPDVILIRPGGHVLLCLELKTEKGRVSKEQKQWLKALEEADYTIAWVVRPSGINQLRKFLETAS